MKFSYDLIEPLLVETELDGSEIICAFEIPGTGEIVESSARIRRTSSVQNDITRQVTRMGTSILAREASRLVRRSLGGGILGRLGSSTVRSASRPIREKMQHTGEDKEEAIVEAFKKVAHRFYFDEAQGQWTQAPAAAPRTVDKPAPEQKSAVEEQIEKSPLSTRFDREVLARILVELAAADGEIESAEQDFLESVVGAEFGSINQLMAMEPVSPVECEELSAGVRETIYLLAWVMTLVDMDASSSERNILLEYAGMFGFSNQKMEELIRKARLYLLESSISADTSREELFDLADRLSIDRGDAERALIRLKKSI